MTTAINPDKLAATVHGLENFVNDCLGLARTPGTLSGFEYVADLLEAAYADSYVETVGRHADSLHRAIHASRMADVANAYLRRAQSVGRRCDLATKDVVLAFDHTDEDYYGELTSPYLHTWTGEAAVSGKWKFLTCAIINRDDPPRVPLLSLPTPIGYEVSRQVAFMIERIRPLVGRVRACLFDRGFYNLSLIKALDELGVTYLIFAPSTAKTRREFEGMQAGERKLIAHTFEYKKDKTTQRGETTLALLKQIFSVRLQKPLDWVFATNQEDLDLDSVIPQYLARWRIETGFRVQDEAHIRSRSTDAAVRYFYFAFEQALQFSWGALYNDQAPYKGFLQQLLHTSRARIQRANQKTPPRTGAES